MFIKKANPDELANQIKFLSKQIRKLKDEIKELKNIVDKYDPFIVKRIMEGKEEKLKDYQEIRNKI
tara:strand:+ start:523 stop:720 length:198 start_codon:yes stop_codon:yes gene_type:complete